MNLNEIVTAEDARVWTKMSIERIKTEEFERALEQIRTLANAGQFSTRFNYTTKDNVEHLIEDLVSLGFRRVRNEPFYLYIEWR